jgi:hypothetical protein
MKKLTRRRCKAAHIVVRLPLHQKSNTMSPLSQSALSMTPRHFSAATVVLRWPKKLLESMQAAGAAVWRLPHAVAGAVAIRRRGGRAGQRHRGPASGGPPQIGERRPGCRHCAATAVSRPRPPGACHLLAILLPWTSNDMCLIRLRGSKQQPCCISVGPCMSMIVHTREDRSS